MNPGVFLFAMKLESAREKKDLKIENINLGLKKDSEKTYVKFG